MDDKVQVSKRLILEVIESLKYFADNTPIQGFSNIDTLVGCVIQLQNAIKTEKGE